MLEILVIALSTLFRGPHFDTLRYPHPTVSALSADEFDELVVFGWRPRSLVVLELEILNQVGVHLVGLHAVGLLLTGSRFRDLSRGEL